MLIGLERDRHRSVGRCWTGRAHPAAPAAQRVRDEVHPRRCRLLRRRRGRRTGGRRPWFPARREDEGRPRPGDAANPVSTMVRPDFAAVRSQRTSRVCAPCARRSATTSSSRSTSTTPGTPDGAPRRPRARPARRRLVRGARADRRPDRQRALARALDTPIAGYETEIPLSGFRDLIAHRAVDIVQPDVIWTGGITVCRRVAALAHAAGLPASRTSTPRPSAWSRTCTSSRRSRTRPDRARPEPERLRTELLDVPVEPGPDAVIELSERPGLGVPNVDRDHVAAVRGRAPPRTSQAALMAGGGAQMQFAGKVAIITGAAPAWGAQWPRLRRRGRDGRRRRPQRGRRAGRRRRDRVRRRQRPRTRSTCRRRPSRRRSSMTSSAVTGTSTSSSTTPASGSSRESGTRRRRSGTGSSPSTCAGSSSWRRRPRSRWRQRSGKIINLASIAGRRGEALVAAYCASKAAVININQSLALALAPYGVNVNAMAPGVVDTPYWKEVDKQLDRAAQYGRG